MEEKQTKVPKEENGVRLSNHIEGNVERFNKFLDSILDLVCEDIFSELQEENNEK